jgi:DNA repair photolyase
MHLKEVKGILSGTNGMNISRGCIHGCIYCDSRSKIYDMDHDFEDVEIKSNAPLLLEKALRGKRKKCMVGTGAMSDPYIPLPENLENIRRCLQIIEAHGFGLSIQTKSSRILRDMDLLKKIHKKAKCVVAMTLTTYDEALCKIIEPQVSTTKERVETLKEFRKAGIPTLVWLCPILPWINDTEENIRGLLSYCEEAGVYGILTFGMGLTLREGNREYFYEKLDKHLPGLKEKYIREYGNRYVLASKNESILMKIFDEFCRARNIVNNADEIFTWLRTYKEKAQPELFDEEPIPKHGED